MAFGRLLGIACAGIVVMATALPASANRHRSDIGARIAIGAGAGVPAAVLIGPASAVQYSASACSWQRQKFWDGYSWRVQRSQVCE